MARGVDNINMRVFPLNGSAFGQNGNAAFSFQIVAVHNASFDFLVFAEGSALFQKAIHQSGFAVVDVGNNGNVSSLHVFSFLKTCRVMGLTAHVLLLCTLRRFF